MLQDNKREAGFFSFLLFSYCLALLASTSWARCLFATASSCGCTRLFGCLFILLNLGRRENHVFRAIGFGVEARQRFLVQLAHELRVICHEAALEEKSRMHLGERHVCLAVSGLE